MSETLIALPSLIHPRQESFIIAHLHSPTSTHLHKPFILKLDITNTHPSITSAGFTLQVDTAESFVWQGNRTSRVNEIQPGGQITARFEMMAVGSVGWFALPKVTIWNGDAEMRTEIPVTTDMANQGLGKESDGAVIFVRP